MRAKSISKNKVNKCYIYTRVSTKMQVDGYSLEAQENRCRAMAEAKGYEVIRVYHDDGKSGKTTEGRDDFNRMLNDIETHKDNVSLVVERRFLSFSCDELFSTV